MKAAFKIGDTFKATGKTCVVGVPIADFDMANVKRLFIQDKAYKVLGFETKSSVWGGVNVYYLLDSQDDFKDEMVYIDEDKFYRELNEPATVETLRYFSK